MGLNSLPSPKELLDSSIRFYEFVFYWASQVATGTGYGDIPLRNGKEIMASGVGLCIGTLMIIYLNARVSSIMVNAERRRCGLASFP
jgi:hypothetical protein